MMTGDGNAVQEGRREFPLRTASSAASSSSGIDRSTWHPAPRRIGPMVASMMTMPWTRAEIAIGRVDRSHVAGLERRLILPPTRTGGRRRRWRRRFGKAARDAARDASDDAAFNTRPGASNPASKPVSGLISFGASSGAASGLTSIGGRRSLRLGRRWRWRGGGRRWRRHERHHRWRVGNACRAINGTMTKGNDGGLDQHGEWHGVPRSCCPSRSTDRRHHQTCRVALDFLLTCVRKPQGRRLYRRIFRVRQQRPCRHSPTAASASRT